MPLNQSKNYSHERRWNGYFYINWDGKIMPCVFVPFYEETVFDVYGGKSRKRRGRTDAGRSRN